MLTMGILHSNFSSPLSPTMYQAERGGKPKTESLGECLHAAGTSPIINCVNDRDALLIPTDEREISPTHKFYSHFDKGGEEEEEEPVSQWIPS